jgi:uncharacterized protein YkwD
MGKHRQERHYRRIVIAAVTIGAVGVPSVAMACGNWRDDTGHRLHGVERHGAEHWRNNANWSQGWNGDEDSEPAATASPTPTASAGTPKPTAPRPRTTTPSRIAKTAAPKPKTTTPSAIAKTTTTPKPKTTTPSSSPKATATASGATARVVELVNAERIKAGCSPLTVNATLTKAAQSHSDDMAAHGTMSHTGSDGSSPGDRLTRAGYVWSSYGENVAYGYATPEQVMAGWMSSPGHKANILNCSFKEIGVGLAQPNNYWTQDFGTARLALARTPASPTPVMRRATAGPVP